MIYPTTQIAKRWYRITEGTTNVVLETYTGKPRGIVTHCVGFDNNNTINGGVVNQWYGKRLPDEQLPTMFPHIKVTYKLKVNNSGADGADNWVYAVQAKTAADERLYVDPLTGKSTTNVTTGNVINQPVIDGDIDHWVDRGDGNVLTLTTYLWLDNMVSEGDEATAINSFTNKYNGTSASVDREQYKFIRKNPDDATDTRTYVAVFCESVNSDIMDMLMSGLKWEEAYDRLPWYINGKGTDANGYTIEVVSSEIYNDSQSDEANLIDLFVEQNAMDEVLAMMSEKIKECRDSVAEMFNTIEQFANSFEIDDSDSGGFYGFNVVNGPSQAPPQIPQTPKIYVEFYDAWGDDVASPVVQSAPAASGGDGIDGYHGTEVTGEIPTGSEEHQLNP